MVAPVSESSVVPGTAIRPRGVARRYEHARYKWRRRILRWLMDHVAFRYLARIDSVQGLEHLPASGPVILMINHIGFIDPIVVMGNVPRDVVPLAKMEVYRLPVVGIFPWLWGVIPVRRGEFDRRALEQALAVLRAGEVVLVAPEGTRHEALSDAKEGLAYLAVKSGASIVPVAIEGTPGYPRLFPPKSQPGVSIRLGRAFRFTPVLGRLPRERLRRMTDEAMYRLAAMLPERRRGRYSDLSKASQDTLAE